MQEQHYADSFYQVRLKPLQGNAFESLALLKFLLRVH